MRLTGRLAVLLAVAAAFVPPAAAQDDEPKKYALLIGINDYTFRDTQIASLAYATLDARAMKRILEDKGYKTVDLIDDEAERDRIVGHLSRIGAVARKNDTFLLYFAGHGVRSKVGKTPTYWLTYDADTRRLDVKGIRLSHLLDYVADIKADRKMVILDHCFSGDVDLKVGTTTDPSRSVDDVTSATIIPAARPAIPTDVFNVAAAQADRAR
jgi:uncharacterized caspase-like protein